MAAVASSRLDELAHEIKMLCPFITPCSLPRGYGGSDLHMVALKRDGVAGVAALQKVLRQSAAAVRSCAISHVHGTPSDKEPYLFQYYRDENVERDSEHLRNFSGAAAESSDDETDLRFVGIWEIDHENRKLQLVRGEFVSRPVARLMATESMVTRLGLSSTNMQPMESSQLMEDCNLLARLNKVPTASSQKGETASATVLTWVQEVYSRAFALKLLAGASTKVWTLLGPDAKPLFYKDRTVAKIVQMMLQGESAGKEERTPAPSKSKSKADVVAGEPASTGKKRNQKDGAVAHETKVKPKSSKKSKPTAA